MNIFFNNFWGSFIDENQHEIFILLFKYIFGQDICMGNYENSDVLIESVFGTTVLNTKKWKYSFLFIGEPTRRVYTVDAFQHFSNYSCVLKGENNNKNVVNFPLFVLYQYQFNIHRDFLMNINKNITKIPTKNICVIVSADDGSERNYFFSELEKKIPIDYAGNYKNNVSRIEHRYFSKEFIEYVSNYKCIITMENTKEEKYITEKILHGFCANTIPIYWGSDYIEEYFNKERYIHIDKIDKDSIDAFIHRIMTLINNDEVYLAMVNKPIITEKETIITLNTIAEDVKKLIG